MSTLICRFYKDILKVLQDFFQIWVWHAFIYALCMCWMVIGNVKDNLQKWAWTTVTQI